MEEKTLALDQAYRSLNAAQRQAVDMVDGPLLVLAGPGTGKTQLLSVRVANIMRVTDTPAQNILCLTFTEGGATNMRERLASFISQAAYDVQIGTYHSFGSDIIRRYPEYFTETRLQYPVDDLGKYQIISEIIGGLSYKNPLKQTQHHLHDLLSTISEVKRALLSSDDLRKIAKENLNFINEVNGDFKKIFHDFKIMPRKLSVALPYFAATMNALQSHAPVKQAHTRYGSLAGVAIRELAGALEEAESLDKTAPLTAWKTKWLAKDASNNFILQNSLETHRLEALASVLEKYQAALSERGLYDFDDMILRTIEVLERNKELKYSLQEQYLYILLDEFQDTNAAQLRLIELLTDNPVSEGRPNVMAVGDDDQAIYTFQGAQYSNMLDFYNMYRDVRVVNLTDNYRSHQHIIETAKQIAEQIDGRLTHELTEITKTLVAKATSNDTAMIERSEFLSDIEQNEWIAQRIKLLIDKGVKPSDIAILAPRHRYLEDIVPYLQNIDIPVRYEKRENILEAPVVTQILLMARLIRALSENNTATANALWPQVLSFEFWQFAPSKIWQLSWEVSESKSHTKNWTQAMLADGHDFRAAALLFVSLAGKIATESCDSMLDYIIGNTILQTNEADTPTVTSPLRDYYLGHKQQKKNAELFYKTLSNINVLRARLRDYQATQEATLLLPDLLEFVDMYLAAGERMVDTSPYNQQANSVQLMTVFKAKGLEYEHVFLPSCQDEVWGGSSRGGSNKLTLPANLTPIRYSGVTDDERLRILFVAITRAKYGLHLSSYQHSFAGKTTKRLRYLNEQEQQDGQVIANVLPKDFAIVRMQTTKVPELEVLTIDWRAQHMEETAKANLKAMLASRIAAYQLSPTHLMTFLDLEYGGPTRFFFDAILRFPRASSTDMQFGNAIHETLEWVQYYVSEHNRVPIIADVIEQFTMRIKAKKFLPVQQNLEIERGEAALSTYMSQRGKIFMPHDKAEINFRNEGVVIGPVHMSGKIDRMEIDEENKTIVVVDYKTGKSYSKWTSEAKLHRYKHQLYCYKLLIENSHTYKNYKVTAGRLEFIEPDSNNEIQSLSLVFEPAEQERTEKLLAAIWEHIQALNFPDVSTYDATLSGIRKFEDDLINGTI